MPKTTRSRSQNAVLLVSARTEDHDSLRGIFSDSRWDVEGAWTARSGLQRICCKPDKIPVVICAWSLPDGDWELVLGEVRKMAVRPSFIVSSRLADERLWAEVLEAGAFDLLQGAPFEPGDVLRVTENAWYAWGHTAQPALRRFGAGHARSLHAASALAASAGRA